MACVDVKMRVKRKTGIMAASSAADVAKVVLWLSLALLLLLMMMCVVIVRPRFRRRIGRV